MGKAGYSCVAGAAVASTTSAKSILGVQAPSGFGVDLTGFKVGTLGIAADAVPGVIQVARCTFATNPPGTSSTSVTPVQDYGRVITVGFTAARDWSAEPTVLEVLEEFPLSPNGATIMFREVLGYTFDCDPTDGFVLRAVYPATVDLRGTLFFERC